MAEDENKAEVKEAEVIEPEIKADNALAKDESPDNKP